MNSEQLTRNNEKLYDEKIYNFSNHHFALFVYAFVGFDWPFTFVSVVLEETITRVLDR